MRTYLQPRETITLPVREREPQQFTVAKACASDTGGHAACADHPGVDMTNNLKAWSHTTSPGRHRVFWLCFEHGPESMDR